jgi:hypothetical protein
MKKLSAVAVAVLLAVSSTYAYWDYFSVIGAGEGEANVSYDSPGGMGFKVRYGLMDNLELVAAGGGMGLHSSFQLGGRYQIIDMLAFSLDLGIPTSATQDIGVVPGLQFMMDINDMISLGVGAGLGIDINHPAPTLDDPEATEALMNLRFGLEVDFNLSDNVMVWVGCDFEMDNMTADNSELEIFPMFGASFSATENLSIGTFLGIDLNRINRKGDEAMGLFAGFDFSVKF